MTIPTHLVLIARTVLACGLLAPLAAQAQHTTPGTALAPPASGAPIKIADPTSVVMIVNRDSNDIAFMDIKTRKMVGKTFLGNNVNPHMVMMSPDGRYVVTGGTNSNTAYIIDARTLELVKKIPVGFAPEHLSFSPDGRYYYQGNPGGDSVTVIDMASLKVIKTIEGLVEPLNITFTPDGAKAYVGNYGAHWIGVIDVSRHELLKKIQLGKVPTVSRMDPAHNLSKVKGAPLCLRTPAAFRAPVPATWRLVAFLFARMATNFPEAPRPPQSGLVTSHRVKHAPRRRDRARVLDFRHTRVWPIPAARTQKA